MKVKLCKQCINELSEYGCYYDEKCQQIPLDKLECEEVTFENCDNYTKNIEI